MQKFLFLFSFLVFGNIIAQKQVNIQYLNVRSSIANVQEDLYTDGTSVLSKQDGNIIWTDANYDTKKKGMDRFYISKISSADRDFFFTTQLDYSQDNYFLYDKVPAVDWKIDKETSKKLLGYNCKKATTVFRGSPITAYFTEEIPYSIGPFKFFGLPGAILDVRADDKNYDLWKAVRVDINDTTKVEYNPQFPDFTKAKMEDFVKLRDGAISTYVNSAKVEGSSSKKVGGRLGIEKVFEWEK